MENPPFEDVFPIGKVNFHCHVSLLEGKGQHHTGSLQLDTSKLAWKSCLVRQTASVLGDRKNTGWWDQPI